MQDHKAPRIKQEVSADASRPAAYGVPANYGTPKSEPGRRGYGEEGHDYAWHFKRPRKRCAGNDGTCKAWPVKGELLCVGHKRAAQRDED